MSNSTVRAGLLLMILAVVPVLPAADYPAKVPPKLYRRPGLRRRDDRGRLSD